MNRFAALVCLFFPIATTHAGGISVEQRNVAGCTVRLVRVPPDSYRVRIGLAQGRVGLTESLAGIAKRYGAVAAINGCFFDAYAKGTIKFPWHNLIKGGEVVHIGNTGTTVVIAYGMVLSTGGAGSLIARDGCVLAYWRGEAGIARRFKPDMKCSYRVEYEGTSDPRFWSGVCEAIGCGARLLKADQVCYNPTSEGFSHAKILSASGARSAIGTTRDRQLQTALFASSRT